jgi:hypothetical protein
VPKVVISDKALREMVAEVLDNTGWSGEGGSTAVVINPVTDPSVSVTDPVNPNYTPQNKTEFGVSMGRLVRNLPDSEMPGIYMAVKKALDQRSEKDEMDAAEQQAMLGGSQEAIDANMGKGKETKHKQEGTMPVNNKIEEQLRAKIRGILLQVLQEAKPFDWKKAPAPTGPLPPVKKIPAGEHGGEWNRREEKTKADLRKGLGHAVEKLDAPEVEDELSAEEGGEEAPTAPARRAYKPTAIGSMANVDYDTEAGETKPASFEEIAKELGFSVAGAKQAVDKALLRFRYLFPHFEDEKSESEFMKVALNAFKDAVVNGKVTLTPEEKERMQVWSYIEHLQTSGELSAGDVQLLHDHPSMVKDLDGYKEWAAADPHIDFHGFFVHGLGGAEKLEAFRTYMHNFIRHQMKQNSRIMDPVRDDDTNAGEPHMADDGEEGGEGGEAPPAPETPAPRPAPKAGKTTYKVYGKLKGAPAHTRVKGKAFLAPADTQFKSGEDAILTPTDGHMSVKKKDGDHTQTWAPETQNETDAPGQIKGKSVADPKTAATASAPPKPGEKSAKMASGKKASIDWGGFDEGTTLAGHLLAEAHAMVMCDSKGPYVIADGVEARPVNPNHTQYRAGTRVNVHRHGKKGVFIVEMPNGEKWTNKPMKG